MVFGQYVGFNFNLLYEAIFYVLFHGYYRKSTDRFQFQSSLWSYILCPITITKQFIFYNIKFQSSLWSYILCPTSTYILRFESILNFNLLYEAIFYVLLSSLFYCLFFIYISIFFMKLYSMSFSSVNPLSIKLLSRISIFFMKLYSMS